MHKNTDLIKIYMYYL